MRRALVLEWAALHRDSNIISRRAKQGDIKWRTGGYAKEPLIKSEVPAAQGSAAIFSDRKPLKMKESENHVFRFPCSEKSRMDLFRASLSQATAEEDRAPGVIPAAAWRVTDVQPLPEYRLKVRFRDKTEGIVDLSRLVTGQAAGVFAALHDPALFAQVRVECGVVTWPGGLDLAPDAMHDAIRLRGEWMPD